MIVDSSALAAIAFDEPERETFLQLVSRDGSRISVATWVESSVVIGARLGDTATTDRFIGDLRLELAEVTRAHGMVARDAYRRYGRGSGSPARLNFGDCFAYALAITTGEPLLFKGEDFTHTDVTPAWRPTRGRTTD